MTATPNQSLSFVISRAARILALLLLLLLPAAVKAQFNYNNNGDGTCTITGYTGTNTVVTVPTTISNLLVTGIGNGEDAVFFGIVGVPDSVTSVTILDSVTNIGNKAFEDCYTLTSVTIGTNVTSIGGGAFFFDTNLTSVAIPNDVTNIGDEAFYSTGLISVTIGTNVTSIGDEAFAACNSLIVITVNTNNPAYSSSAGVLFNKGQTTLIQYPSGNIATSYTIPGSVANIGDDAFFYGTNLTSVTIPASVTSIGDDAFDYDISLTSVTIPSSVTSIGAGAFWQCYSLTSVTIPNSIINIAQATFEDCFALTSIIIPASVTNIGDEAFAACFSLISVNMQGNAPIADNTVFADSYSQTGYDPATAYYFPGTSGWSSTFAGIPTEILNAPSPDGSLQVTILPTGITTISDGAQWEVDGGILQPSGATVLGLTVGNHLVTFTTISGWTTPASQTVSVSSNSIATATGIYTEEAQFEFIWTTNADNTLTITAYTGLGGAVTIPTNINGLTVTGIALGAFENCTGLTGVTIPESVTSIGLRSFVGCTSLTAITVDAANSYYSSLAGVLFNTNQTTLIEYPGGEAGNYTIPNSVTSIGDSAFEDCTSLTSVTIPNSVTNIGDYAFSDCSRLTSITIPDSVTSIGDYAFETTRLASVTIPDSVTNIADGAFAYCTTLTNVTIPESVTSIGDYAFYECSSLTSVQFEGNAPGADSTVFSDDNNATVYYLPGTTGWGSMFADLPALPLYTVTVSASPTNGGTVSGSGTFASNSTVTVMAIATNGYMFTNWMDGGRIVSTSTNYSFMLTSNAAIVATFLPSFTVTVSASPTNGGTANGGGTFASNNAVTVTATVANSGYAFTNWTTNEITASTSSDYTFTLAANVTLVAHFVTTLPQIGVFEVFNGTTNVVTNGQTVSFGSVQINQTGPTVDFTVNNSGGQSLTVTNITVPSGYALITNAPLTITNFPFTIVGLSNGTFSVQLTNINAVGTNVGNIAITNNGSTTNTFSFAITGKVTAKIISLSDNLAFGVVPIGSSAQRILTISNLGNATLTVSNIIYPAGFGSNWSGGQIAPGNSQQVTVTFKPATATNYGGTITVVSDAASGASNSAVTAFGANSNLLLTIITNGEGKVTPNDAKLIPQGKKVVLTATPDKGYVFAGWTGSTNSTNDPLVFFMQESYVVEANFILNPYVPFTGIYNGLFWPSNGVVTETDAGMLKDLTLTTKGTYSATMLYDGVSKGFSGSFDIPGTATKTLSMGAKAGTLGVVMNLASNEPAPQITGTVSGSRWVSILTATATNALPSAEFTLLVPPDTNNTPPTGSPGGDGYALITNSAGNPKNPATANAKITGALADGTIFNETVPVSEDGFVPIYASLYHNSGLLLGWINLEPTNASAMSLAWVHPTVHSGFFTNTFFSTNQILLSPWSNSSTSIFAATNLSILSAINDTNALMIFTVIVSNNFKLGEVSGLAPFSGSINPETGLLKVAIGSGANKITGYGAILLNATSGGGYFLTKTNAGAVTLEP